MKIFKVNNDACTHIFSINDRDLYGKLGLRDQIGFGIKVDMESMNKITFYVDVENGPDQQMMDYMRLNSRIIIQVNKNTEKLLPYFQKAGQVIPLNMLKGKPFDDLKCNIFNITNIVDCFNEKRSEIKYLRDSTKIYDIRSYSFIESEIPASTGFFSIPNIRVKDIFLVTGINKPEEDFYFLYHKLGMTGLKFKEIYRSSGERDYDLDATIEKMNNGEKLETAIFKKGILGSIFG